LQAQCPRAGQRAPDATELAGGAALDRSARRYGAQLQELVQGLPPGLVRDELQRAARVIPLQTAAVTATLISEQPVRFAPADEARAFARLLLVDHLASLCREASRTLNPPRALEEARTRFVAALTPYLLRVSGRTRLALHRETLRGSAPSPFCVLEPTE
jgi:hypothetical protein